MRPLNLSMLAAGGLVVALLAWKSQAEPAHGSPDPRDYPRDGRLITHAISAGAGGDRIVIVDPIAKVMAVYRVGREHGEITLESVRNVYWDLRMQHFNTAEPTPEQLRASLARQ